MAEKKLPGWLAPALRAAAGVSGAFGLIVASLILVTALKLQSTAPLGSTALKSLKDRMSQDGAGEELYQDIRNLDLLARTAYFTSQGQMVAGTGLYIGAWGLAFGMLQLARLVSGVRPLAFVRKSDPWQQERQFRRGTLIAGGILALGCVGSLTLVPLGAWEPGGIARPGAAVATEARDSHKASTADFSADWLRQWAVFRGPRAGIAIDPAIPAELSAMPAGWKNGAVKVLWETQLPAAGMGSPVLWDKTVFLNAADEKRQLILAIETDRGTVQWETDLLKTLPAPEKKPQISPSSGLATPTMTVDGEREYALFPTGRLVGLDRDGRLSWNVNLGLPDNTYGIASSLTILKDSLILQFDQTEKSVIAAYHSKTGDLRWQKTRDSEASWSSPLAIQTKSGYRIIVAGNPNLTAYKPEDGSIAWSLAVLGGEVAPSPAWYGDTVYVANQSASAAAIPLPAAEAGKPASRWEFSDDLPDISSPTAWSKALVFCSSQGRVTCLEAETGKMLWQVKLTEGINASPLLLGNQILICTIKGSLIALDNQSGKTKWSLKLGSPIMATPAWHEGKLYVRTKKSIMAIGAK